MKTVTLCIKKKEPYCLFLDFVDNRECAAFKNACQSTTIACDGTSSMLCIKNISIGTKRKLLHTDTFQVKMRDLVNLPWQPDNMDCVLYALDMLDTEAKVFESILPSRK
jgi:hypothetical protein